MTPVAGPGIPNLTRVKISKIGKEGFRVKIKKQFPATPEKGPLSKQIPTLCYLDLLTAEERLREIASIPLQSLSSKQVFLRTPNSDHLLSSG